MLIKTQQHAITVRLHGSEGNYQEGKHFDPSLRRSLLLSRPPILLLHEPRRQGEDETDWRHTGHLTKADFPIFLEASELKKQLLKLPLKYSSCY